MNKPAGIQVNETETSSTPEALVRAFRDRDARVVHRLDRDTTGVLVFGKGRAAAAALSAAFADRKVQKTYWAMVEGPGFDGVIEAAVGRDRRRPRARAVVAQGGQAARTEVRTIGGRPEWSLVEARPVTGRTHQIRVHLAHVNAPIIGDVLYGGPSAVRLQGEVIRVGRPLLHALELGLPGSQTFRAAVPDDLGVFARALGAELEEPEAPMIDRGPPRR